MAGLSVVFAEFERDILRERVRARLALAPRNGKRLGRTITARDSALTRCESCTWRRQQSRYRDCGLAHRAGEAEPPKTFLTRLFTGGLNDDRD
jgi:hypothetical protein